MPDTINDVGLCIISWLVSVPSGELNQTVSRDLAGQRPRRE